MAGADAGVVAFSGIATSVAARLTCGADGNWLMPEV